MTEDQIIDRVLTGEKAAYELLVREHESYAYTLALKVLNNREEAEEAAQDAFVKAYRSLAKFDRKSKFSTWLYRIVYNTSISYVRKRKKIVSFNIEIHNSIDDSPNTLEESDKKKYLNQALAKLKPDDAAIITLFYLKDFNIQEISEMLNIRKNNVKIKLFRSRKKLAEELENLLSKEAVNL